MNALIREQETRASLVEADGESREALSRCRPLRILHVIDSGGLYGAERVLLSLGIECTKIGHEVFVGTIVATQDVGDPLGMAAVGHGLNHVQFVMRDGLNIGGLRTILRYARQSGIDVMHSHGYKANILLALAPRSLRPCPMLCTLHGWTATGAGSMLSVYEWLERRLVGRFDAVVVVSDAIKNQLKSSSQSLRLIRNGIPVSLSAGMEGLRGSHVSDKRIMRVLAAGRLSHEKGFDVLIRAIEILRAKGIEVKATIAGEGPERARLQAQIENAGLQDEVRLAGYVTDMDSLFLDADVFVLCSRTEGLPIVLLEAMVRAVPVIATAVGQVPEVLGDGDFGHLLPPGDSDSLARAIGKHASGVNLGGEDILANAASRVRQDYSANAMSAAYCNVYRELLSGH